MGMPYRIYVVDIHAWYISRKKPIIKQKTWKHPKPRNQTWRESKGPNRSRHKYILIHVLVTGPGWTLRSSPHIKAGRSHWRELDQLIA
jgi:hypothetical protein